MINSQTNLFQQPSQWFYAFWKFSRPHTIIGTSLSVLALYVITLATTFDNATLLHNLASGNSWLQLLLTWIACLSGNIYIVGLNQLEDVEIDQINKPDLPVASGEFSLRQGQVIVCIFGILALLLAWLLGPWLLLMVGVSLAIGTAYSLPPIRLKRFPVWAALCIFLVRGVVVNLGLFFHFSWLEQRDGLMLPTPAVWALTGFILVFTFAIAIFKDIPDMEGDKQYNITTFTIQLGKPAVFNLARWVLTVCYLGMILAGLWLNSVNLPFLLTTHLVALGWMWWQSWRIDLQDKNAICLQQRFAITQYYQFIWKLFFLEYLIFPSACLLG